jgi:protein gp37
MSNKTKIQWTDGTVNFWSGCKKVSEGCKNCYMFRDKERYGKNATEVIAVKEATNKANLRKLKVPSLIFTCSYSDFFIEEADGRRAAAWQTIKAHPQHQWQILTKRPERILECLPQDWGEGYANVWLGMSVENQRRLEERIPLLQQVPAAVRFLSCEPLLEAVTFSSEYGKDYLKEIHWVIIGGESGNQKGKYRYRPCAIPWIEAIVQQCREADVAVFVKQMGTHLAKSLSLKDRKGGKMEEWPASLQLRQYPWAYIKRHNTMDKTNQPSLP